MLEEKISPQVSPLVWYSYMLMFLQLVVQLHTLITAYKSGKREHLEYQFVCQSTAGTTLVVRFLC